MTKPEPTQCERCHATLEPIGFDAIDGERTIWRTRSMCDGCLEVREQERASEIRQANFNAWASELRSRIGERLVRPDLEESKLLHAVVDIAFDDSEISDECAAYISGPVGTLKTRKAVESCLYYLQRKADALDVRDAVYDSTIHISALPRVWYTTELDMLAEMRPGGSHNVRFYQQREYLVLDDLGLAKDSEWTNQQLYQVVDHRYRHCLPTVFISNKTLPELKADSALYDDRLIRRISEMCGKRVVEVER